MSQVTSHLVELDAVTDGRYGGKALGLARLAAAGFPVPAAFVLADADPDALPDGLRERLATVAGPVAVRSSAVGEDGAGASFAGQYESVLGVEGYEQLVAAVAHCVASAGSDRATAYRSDSGTGGRMHLVVQEMVDARAAGVVFTADPASARRDLAVVDAVAGLGESLVDGSASPDHFEVDLRGEIVHQHGAAGALSTDEVAAVVTGARQAEALWGEPLDLEWAVDRSGALRWLQARPITTLPAALDARDSAHASPEHVYTRCNIGEMMPGAFCPLTASVSGHAIDFAMQSMQVVGGGRKSYDADRWLQVGYFSGHMFLDMTEGTRLGAGILGNSTEQYSMSIAGRIVDELAPLPPGPFLLRLGNTVKLSAYALTAGTAIRRLDAELARTQTPSAPTPAALLAELDAAVRLYEQATLTHVRSSSRAAVAANVLEDAVVKAAVKAGRSEDDGRADASALLAGATGVESAVMLEELDALVARLAETGAQDLLDLAPAEVVARLQASSPPFCDWLARNGHRGYRELDLRDPSWGDDPAGLGSTVQAMLRARLAGGAEAPPARPSVDGLPRALQALARLARAGARGREATKSRMVLVAHRLSRGYRLLGEQLAAQGRLPDADLVFFFDRSELPALLSDADTAGLVATAQALREALPYQERLQFADVSVGKPVPVRPEPAAVTDGVIVGRPASAGVVEGTVRVARTVHEAHLLEPGEILVAPVTDVGWTPYFTLIGALVTDIGSSVSHGAVVAREYGLPCVVGTLGASLTLQTGDRVRVDGHRGTVTVLSSAEQTGLTRADDDRTGALRG